MLLCKTGHGLPREAKKISTETWTDVAIEMWKGMDLDENNNVSFDEFEKYWSQALTHHEMGLLMKLFPIIDDNQNGLLQFDEILKNGKGVIVKAGLLGMMWMVMKSADSEEALAKIKIDADALRQNWKKQFTYFSEEEIDRIVSELDVNNDNMINHMELFMHLHKM